MSTTAASDTALLKPLLPQLRAMQERYAEQEEDEAAEALEQFIEIVEYDLDDVVRDEASLTAGTLLDVSEAAQIEFCTLVIAKLRAS